MSAKFTNSAAGRTADPTTGCCIAASRFDGRLPARGPFTARCAKCGNSGRPAEGGAARLRGGESSCSAPAAHLPGDTGGSRTAQGRRRKPHEKWGGGGELLQSNELYRAPTEFVKHSAYRGSSHRRKGATCQIIAMVWLCRSPVPVGRKGVIFLFLVLALVAPRGGGWGQLPVEAT